MYDYIGPWTPVCKDVQRDDCADTLITACEHIYVYVCKYKYLVVKDITVHEHTYVCIYSPTHIYLHVYICLHFTCTCQIYVRYSTVPR